MKNNLTTIQYNPDVLVDLGRVPIEYTKALVKYLEKMSDEAISILVENPKATEQERKDATQVMDCIDTIFSELDMMGVFPEDSDEWLVVHSFTNTIDWLMENWLTEEEQKKFLIEPPMVVK